MNADVYFAHKHSVSIEMSFHTELIHQSLCCIWIIHTSCFDSFQKKLSHSLL